ncbi:MAG: hypothetical protein ACD_10C00010G0007 [uncultured bacterium]|nr:MAG: hypothetical protein ACD_10C00010G0007 [uncultured bacterium]
MPLDNRIIRAHLNRLRIIEGTHLGRNIFRNINHDRAGTASRRNMEGFFDRHGQILDVFNQEVVFDAGSGNTDCVALLERILADIGCRHLTGDDNHRNRVHVGSRNTGHGIGHARPRCHQSDTYLLRRTRIGIRRVNRSLLMAHENVLDLVLPEKSIVDMENGTTWVTEHTIHLFFLQAPDYNFCTADHHS